MRQQQPDPCEYCADILDLDSARLCQRVFSPEPYQLPLPLSPPPKLGPRMDPAQIALPLSPPPKFDRLTDVSNASLVSQPLNFAHYEERNGTSSHEPRPPQHDSEIEKDDDRKYISVRELFDDVDEMNGAPNEIIPPHIMSYIQRNPANPNSPWYPDWYRFPEFRHLIPSRTWADRLPPRCLQLPPPAHSLWSFDPPLGWPQHPLLRYKPPYGTMP